MGNRTCSAVMIAASLIVSSALSENSGKLVSAAEGHAAIDKRTQQRTRYPTPKDDLTERSSFLRIQRDQIVDGKGRQVLLHGLSVISKSKSENYLSWHRAEEFAAMRRWGMNCIRLGILWDGLEPEPGKFDDAYLDGVAERIDWARQHGLFVFLDMHQDLYSVLYSDGAPAWATLHDGKPHQKGAVWSDSYMISPAVHAAFDHFWANAPAADGVGLQDHYAAAWRHVAKRFTDDPTVTGYDLMNEPFEGSSVVASQIALLQSPFAKLLMERLGDKAKSPQGLAAMWFDPKGREAITAQLNDMEVYEAFIEAQQKHSQAFERERLQPMLQRVANAIREVDARHILMLETSYHCNAGVLSGIEPVKSTSGQRDPQQLYAPHAYDIVVDTPALANGSSDRVALIFRRHGETANRLKMPMVIGEWGALGNAGDTIIPTARVLQQQIERLRCSDIYWDYGRDIDKQAYFMFLNRAIPVRVAGTLLEYNGDPEASQFTCRWKESNSVTAPTILYVPEATFQGGSARLEPEGKGFVFKETTGDPGGVYISIPPTGKTAERSFTLGVPPQLDIEPCAAND